MVVGSVFFFDITLIYEGVASSDCAFDEQYLIHIGEQLQLDSGVT
jgi:hypothetical protein